MQPIQDKDFDRVFKNTFDDAEVAPSRDLWSSIESEIEPKKKKNIPLYWLSAAAVLLIVTVGLLVYQQLEIKPKQLVVHIAPKVVQPVIESHLDKDSIKALGAPTEKIEQVLPTVSKPVEAIAKTKAEEDVKPEEKQRITTAPEMQKQETLIAKVEEPKQDIKKKIEEVILQPKAEAISMVETATTDVVNENDQSNKGIRNVGDVINLIVNKVDKRKDKFIQFRNDDGESSVASINIGPFKIGRRNK